MRSAAEAAIVAARGQWPCKAIHRATASIAAVANVLPKNLLSPTNPAGSQQSRTMPPARGGALGDSAALPFTQREQGRFGEREEKTGPSKNNTTTKAISRWRHALSMSDQWGKARVRGARASSVSLSKIEIRKKSKTEQGNQ